MRTDGDDSVGVGEAVDLLGEVGERDVLAAGDVTATEGRRRADVDDPWRVGRLQQRFDLCGADLAVHTDASGWNPIILAVRRVGRLDSRFI